METDGLKEEDPELSSTLHDHYMFSQQAHGPTAHCQCLLTSSKLFALNYAYDLIESRIAE